MPETKTREVTFHSTLESHRLVIPGHQKDYEFVHGRIMGETKGRTIEFTKHMKVTADPLEIDYLRSRIADGDPHIRELEVQVPDPSPVLAELATASADRTREILQAEIDGWEREVVITTCQAKLASVGGRPRKTD